MLVNKFNDFAKEILVKAGQLMSDKYTDNDKAGIGLSGVLMTPFLFRLKNIFHYAEDRKSSKKGE